MARFHGLITDFTGGELSPRWMARVQGGDIDPLQGGGSISRRYVSGCRELTNGIVMPQGGVAKRQAFRFARDITDDMPEGTDVDRVRIITFEAPGSDYLTVWADRWVGVYETADLAADQEMPAPAFTSATPFAAADLCYLHFAQLQNAMILFTCKWRPRLLRLTSSGWEFVDVASTTFVPPVYDYADQASPPRTSSKYSVSFTVPTNRWAYCSVSGIPINAINTNRFTIVAASTGSTLTNFTNALLKIASIVPASLVVTYVGDGTTLEYEVEYEFLGSLGNGSGELVVDLVTQRTGELVTVEGVDEGTSGAEMLWSGPVYTLLGGVYYKCIAPHVSSTADNRPGTGTSWATYWEVIGASLPNDNVDRSFIGVSPAWEENVAYYPGNRGWPGSGTAHEQRLIASGPQQARGVLAGSRVGVGKFLDFTSGVNPSDGFVFLLAASQGATISWIHSQRFLFVGTSIGLFVQSAVPMTPTSVLFSRQSNYTVSRIQGFDVAGEVFYIQRNGRQLRRAQYVDAMDSWQSTDMTAPIEHLFMRRPFFDESGQLTMVDAAYQNSPDSVLWILRSDGALASMTYERFLGVSAWSKHTTRYGNVRALSSFYGGESGADMVAILVERSTVENGNRLVVEYIPETSRNEYRVMLNDEREYSYEQIGAEDWPPYMDSAAILAGNGTITLATPPRFDGLEVEVVEDGIYLGAFTPSSGVLTLHHPTTVGSRIFVGYRYKTKIAPVKMEVAASLTGQSQKVRWVRPSLRLFASAMPTVNGQRLRERSPNDDYDTATSLFTGDVEIVNLGHDGELVIEADLPLPFQVSGVFGIVTVEGG
jgi:hypothetical protein